MKGSRSAQYHHLKHELHVHEDIRDRADSELSQLRRGESQDIARMQELARLVEDENRVIEEKVAALFLIDPAAGGMDFPGWEQTVAIAPRPRLDEIVGELREGRVLMSTSEFIHTESAFDILDGDTRRALTAKAEALEQESPGTSWRLLAWAVAAMREKLVLDLLLGDRLTFRGFVSDEPEPTLTYAAETRDDDRAYVLSDSGNGAGGGN